MTTHAFKGRGELTLGTGGSAKTLEVTTEINLQVEMDRVPIPYWPDLATGQAPGGIKEVAQRVRSVQMEMTLHDYAPSVLATALGGTATSGATGYTKVNMLNGDTATSVALSFVGFNKLHPATGQWQVSMPKFCPQVIESLPVVGATIAGYRLTGYSLRDPTATGAEYGYLNIATG